MRYGLVLASCLVLAACGTPQQQCIRQVTTDLQVVDRLITEVQGNLSRGYTYQTVTRTMPEFQDCTPDPSDKRPNPKSRLCLEDVTQTFQRPQAIDLDAEAAKLASLQRKRTQLATAAAPAIQACVVQYPQAAN